MTITEYLKNKKLSYKKVSVKLEMDVAHVYRALNNKKNSLGTKVKPSDEFLSRLERHFPELANIYLVLSQQTEE